ncbi:hypothetical protein PBY51_001973 [Eleginops maclovinus]|uniref:RUN domain-containing protein n=1 Tax=Eleginops maclovinus TaxID=56733 RepID=A0AAN8ADL0_ELEMC|nr:hypothetical protein PBY51_001973 [Eleginops maclovinus]
MLATQIPDAPPEAKDVKQIKDKLAKSLKALQKRYVTSDAVVTSENSDANLLCCALEAIFIHGIKSKYVRSEAGGRSRKGDRCPLPQPFFWSLLKTVTHRDVVTELEKISFVGTEVGRCRAWLRLALNHGLLECYLVSLFREGSKLRTYYQPSALLLNTEEREVLLSYLQGLASLTFNLSYKSAVLNEWTTTPLALAGLCPMSQVDTVELPLNGGDHPNSKSVNKEWDTVSQSSGSSDTQDLQRGCPGRGTGLLQGGRNAMNSSNVSLDTTGSSQLSSSLSSDSLLQGQDPRSPTGEPWYDQDMPINVNISTKKLKDSPTEFRESGHCSQDSMREDSFVSSTDPDQNSETAVFSGSDSDTQGPPTSSQELVDPLPNSDSEPSPTSDEIHVDYTPSEVGNHTAELLLDTDTLSTVGEPVESVEEEQHTNNSPETTEPVEEEREEEETPEPTVPPSSSRSTSILSRKLSTDSLNHSCSWISEDDIYMPHLEEVPDNSEPPPPAPPAEPSQSPPWCRPSQTKR